MGGVPAEALTPIPISKVALPFPGESKKVGTSLVIQRLRLCTSRAADGSSIPGRTKVPHAVCGAAIEKQIEEKDSGINK